MGQRALPLRSTNEANLRALHNVSECLFPEEEKSRRIFFLLATWYLPMAPMVLTHLSLELH